MPMEMAEKIDEIFDVDVFIENFVDTTNSLSNVSSLSNANRRSKYSNFFIRMFYLLKQNILI